MKLLVLGGKGMAGHMIVDYFRRETDWDVYYTSRDQQDQHSIYLDVLEQTQLEWLIDQLKPDVVINAVGLLNENAEHNKLAAFQVNSLLPHLLAKFVDRYDGKVIQISTDCVFSGRKGDYSESDEKDGTSVYATTKSLGEITHGNHLTIRTSIIGPELKEDGIGLFLWFMNQKGHIKGYNNVMWNGVTTLELAKAIETFINNKTTGLCHLGCAEKISKYKLLKTIQVVFDKNDVIIEPDSKIVLDRTIRNTRQDHIYIPPTYWEMLTELHDWMTNDE